MSDTSDMSDFSEDSTQAYDEDEPDMDILAVQEEMDEEYARKLQEQFYTEGFSPAVLTPDQIGPNNTQLDEYYARELQDRLWTEVSSSPETTTDLLSRETMQPGQIKAGAPLTAMSGCKTPPTLLGALLLKAAKQGSLVLVRALLCHSLCDLAARDEEGNTALHIAASSGHHKMMEELAGRYSAPSAGKNNEGHTPLHLACSKGKAKCVKILVTKFPCELQMKDNDGKTPANLACLYGHSGIVASLQEIEVLQ